MSKQSHNKKKPRSSNNSPATNRNNKDMRNSKIKSVKAQSPQKRALTKKEIARRKRAAIEKRRQRRELFILKLIVFLTFYTLISLIIVGFIFFSLKVKADSLKINNVELVINEDTTIKLSGQTLVQNNTIYIPYEQLDKMCNFVLTGDNNKITLIITSSIDYVSFYKNSNQALIGGTSYRISAPVLFEKDDYYIPIDFIANYMEGIAVEYNQKTNSYQLTYTGEPITFSGKFPASTDRIDVLTAPSIPAPDTSEEIPIT